jgi:hypothetical protein
MSRVAILGAGHIGAAVAERLARTGWCRAIVLVDPMHEVAAGKALDIRQSGAIEGSRTSLEWAADGAACASASLIIVRRRGGTVCRTAGQAALAVVARAGRANADAPILCAGGHRWLIEHALLEEPTSRTRSARRRMGWRLRTRLLAAAGGVGARRAASLAGVPRDRGRLGGGGRGRSAGRRGVFAPDPPQDRARSRQQPLG